MVEFVSYTGAYPNLCAGVLTLKIEGEVVKFPPFLLSSNGRVWFDEDWREHVDKGTWSMRGWSFPKEYLPWLEEIEKVVNENVPQGCCGGCV